MKNYLIITLGTRDVQLRKSLLEESKGVEVVYHENGRIEIKKNDVVCEGLKNRGFDDYFAIPPRVSGKIINDNFTTFEDFIEFPLFSRVIDEIRVKNAVDYVVLVYTDQQKEFEANQVEQFNYNNDTLFFKDIILKAFKKDPKWSNTKFDEYVIQEKVVDIDFQYDHFGKGIAELFLTDRDEIGQVFLLPQGGIDQINHAITLQLIQEFKTKVKLYQKAEKNEPRLLEFTNHFLNDLNKQKIIKHLEDYDFDKVPDFFYEENVAAKLAKYASLRLKLRPEEAQNLLNSFSKADKSKIGHDFFQKLNIVAKGESRVSKNQKKLIDLVYYFKILLQQKKYSDALIKLFTIAENLFKIEIEKKLNLETDLVDSFFNPEIKEKEINAKWKNFLEELDSDLYQCLDKKGIWVNNPNRRAYLEIIIFLVNSNKIHSKLGINELRNVGHVIEDLSRRRNGIAHSLSSITDNEFNKILSKKGFSQDSFLGALALLLFDGNPPQSKFGIYDEMKEICLSNL